MCVRYFLVLMTAMLLLLNSCFGQSTCLKVSPQHMLLGTYKLELEKSFHRDASFIVSPSYTNYRSLSEEIDGAGIEMALRFYFNQGSSRMLGCYGQFTLLYGNYNRTTEGIIMTPRFPPSFIIHSELIDQYGADLIVGQQVNWKNILCLDVYIGLGIRDGIGDRNPLIGYFNVFDIGYSGPIPKGGLKIGLRF